MAKTASTKHRFSPAKLDDFKAINDTYPIENEVFYTLMRSRQSSAAILVALANQLEKQIIDFEKPAQPDALPQMKLDFAPNPQAASVSPQPKTKNKKRSAPDRMQLAIDFSANQQPIVKPYSREDFENTLTGYTKPHDDDSVDMLLKRRTLAGTIRSFRHILGMGKKFAPHFADSYPYPNMQEIIRNGMGGETVAMRVDQIKQTTPVLGAVMTDWIHSAYEGQKAIARNVSLKANNAEITRKPTASSYSSTKAPAKKTYPPRKKKALVYKHPVPRS